MKNILKPYETCFMTRLSGFSYAGVLVVSFMVSISNAQHVSQEKILTEFRDPPICSSFEPIPTSNTFGCEVTSNGTDDRGDERKVVKINLTAQTKEINIGGELIKTENYGTYLPPVVEARAGDTVAVTLTNSLDEPLIQSGHHSHHCEIDEDQAAPINSNPTNLHYFHGGIVTPNNGNSPNSARWGTGDNIYSVSRQRI